MSSQDQANGKGCKSVPDGDGHRLPRNAQLTENNSGSDTNSTPRSIRIASNPTNTVSKATDRLASTPSSIPRSLQHLSDHLSASYNSSGEDSDTNSLRCLPNEPLDKAVAARRLKRHLVTRSPTDKASTRPSVGGSSALRNTNVSDENDDDDDEGGYVGDDNEDEDDSNNNANARDSRVIVDPLTLPSGDTTYGIYRWHRAHDQEADSSSAKRKRHGSFSAMASDSEWDVSYSQRQLNAPGGFRRQFLQERALRQGRPPVNMLTENFVDFIGLYGHFAGGDYPSDEDDEEVVGQGEGEELPVDEDAPLLRRQHSYESSHAIRATASNKKAFFLLMKAFVGTGVLVLPKAFSNGGLLVSAAVMMFVAWYAWHCMILLAEVYLKVGGSYSELGYKLFGNWARKLITISIILAQVGFCSAYTIFVATNVRDLWNTLTGCRYNFSSTFWVLAQLFAYIPLAWVRKIKQFAPFALAANIFIMLGLGYVLLYDIGSIATNGIADIVQYNPLRFPLLVGTAVFAYEGVTLVIPVLDSMTHKDKFSTVLTIALGVCIVIFVGIGSLSYMAFGDSVETVILLNLPKGSPSTTLVQLFYSLAIMLSVPLQLFPAVRILESGIFPPSTSGKGDPRIKWQKNMFRALMVLVIAMIAIFGADQLDNFIAIIGAFSCTPLSFIIPAALHYQISPGRWWTRVKDVILAAIGFVILIYVTYIGIQSWGAAQPPVDRCA
ncbi:hypothetical protein GGI12_004855 [Dipsacomyces acuminosporus]|nr:hypothetical protein GGI12_004855 [Dipsacomyces acuminosporus]